MDKIENKIQGRIIIAMPETGGTGKNGNPWKKQEFVLETADNYPKKILFTLWGEKIDQYGLREGDLVTALVDIESREYNGRWYTDLKAWKVDKSGAGTPSANPASPVSGRVDISAAGPEDALPF
jgi:hypothetical protein